MFVINNESNKIHYLAIRSKFIDLPVEVLEDKSGNSVIIKYLQDKHFQIYFDLEGKFSYVRHSETDYLHWEGFTLDYVLKSMYSFLKVRIESEKQKHSPRMKLAEKIKGIFWKEFDKDKRRDG